MYKPHRKVLHALNALNPAILKEVGAYFGGSTLISLLYGEYCWSKDVYFLCPVGPGSRRLRQIIAQAHFKPSVFFSDQTAMEFPRNLTANQYGIKFLAVADGAPIKFEIVTEASIALDPPEFPERLPVPCLNKADRYAGKLLANADRWPDASIASRDLIDLAILRFHHGPSEEALLKAEDAYPVIGPLKAALQKFQSSKAYRHKCFSALEVEDKSRIIDGIDLLASDYRLDKTDRAYDELRK